MQRYSGLLTCSTRIIVLLCVIGVVFRGNGRRILTNRSTEHTTCTQRSNIRVNPDTKSPDAPWRALSRRSSGIDSRRSEAPHADRHQLAKQREPSTDGWIRPGCVAVPVSEAGNCTRQVSRVETRLRTNVTWASAEHTAAAADRGVEGGRRRSELGESIGRIQHTYGPSAACLQYVYTIVSQLREWTTAERTELAGPTIYWVPVGIAIAAD
jgi:hypothetical protein